MAKAKIIRVFGKADDFDIELSRKGKKWEVDIPPDMTDGVYAVQLTAIDVNGESAYWVGELYMTDGVCCFKIVELTYKTKIRKNVYETKFRIRNYDMSCSSSLYEFDFSESKDVQIRKNNRSKTNYEVKTDTRLNISDSAEKCTLTIEAKETETKKAKDFHIEFTPKTEIFIRKGCCH